MRTVSRLRLLCFASLAEFPQPYGFHIPVLSTNLLVALSNLGQAHHKKINNTTIKITIANNDGNLI